eukprot:TRINITY_DN2620_c0_g1_i1.p1 TRINITY_DN2620_c0_g1~~TRINITY_DN2620_c0_g1_i1.p1  ORF type:complete len:610 (+),score=175.35 TRINITY_DN2620_c0_g1_i1:125-1954(+)
MRELRNFFLLSFVFVALPLLASSTQEPSYEHFTPLSFRLVLAVQKYRKDLGLPHLSLSPQLMGLAATHVNDLKENFASLEATGCNSPLSWSASKTGKGRWSACCLSTKNTTDLTDCSVDKTAELLVGYEGLAKEIIVKIGEETSVERILEVFLVQKNFLSVIANTQNYRFVEWKTIGAAVDGGFASIWFGNAVDKTKWHNQTGLEAPIPTPEGRLVKCDYLDGLDEGAAVVEMLSIFRAQQNISSIPTSPVLMQLARAHVKDLYSFYYTRNGAQKSCSELSWFNNSGYHCCVPLGDNGEDSACVHQAPKKIASYDGDAYEIVYVDKNRDANLEPLDILTRILKTPLYNAVVFNERLSENQDFTYAKWLAAGAAVKGGVASIWIGDSDDFVDCIGETKTTITSSSSSSSTTTTTTTTTTTEEIISGVDKVVTHVTYHRYDFAEAAYSLATAVNKYRTSNKLSALLPSPSLFAIADLHVDSLVKDRTKLKTKGCTSLLSWGGDVQWEECCLTTTSKDNECSETKPAEVTKEYQGKATEFIVKVNKNQTPEQAFNALLKKSSFKKLLSGADLTTIGAEFDQGYASVWLGTGSDASTWFKKTTTTASGPVKTR